MAISDQEVSKLNHENLGYLVALEPLWSPILQSQVIDLLCELPEKRRGRMYLLWFYRPDWSFRYQAQIRRIETLLSQKHITLIKLPLVARMSNASCWAAFIIAFQIILGILYTKMRYGLTTVHCRSYVPSFSVAILRRLGMRVRLIFDPRSAFPEENVAAALWSENSLSYRFWKSAEKFILSQSDVVVTVTEAMLNDLRRYVAFDHKIAWKVIPNNYSGSCEKLSLSAICPPAGDVPELCYSGSIGHGHWNSIDTYVTFLERVISYRPNWKMTFLVPERQVKPLARALGTAQIPLYAWAIKSVQTKDLVATLSEFTVGLQIMQRRDSRMGIKIAEYLAAGLPILTSENVLGAAEISRKAGIGFVLKGDYSNLERALDYVEQIFSHREPMREKCREAARVMFSTKAVATKYEEVYSDIDT